MNHFLRSTATAPLPRGASASTAVMGAEDIIDLSDTIKTVQSLELEQFMGDWYVIANVPTLLEKNVYNTVERYDLGDDGTIKTTLSFSRRGFDQPRKSYHPRGFIQDDSNAYWRVQFVWPIKAEYRVIFVDDTYQLSMIGRSKRDYLWIMARTPIIPTASLNVMIDYAVSLGYDQSSIKMVPQSW